AGVPSPVKRPEAVDMVIFRENTEDIYAGIEFAGGTPESGKILDYMTKEFPESARKIRFGSREAVGEWTKMAGSPVDGDQSVRVGVGVKVVSFQGSARLVRAAIKYALENKRRSVTFVHKGNIMKFTEGAFRDWGYQIAEKEFGEKVYTWSEW